MMDPMSNRSPAVSSLSSAVQDYLKVIWNQAEWGGVVSTKVLSDHFGVPPARVSEMIKKLAADGLVDHQPYRAITLTRQGERLALQMVRRHRLIETFLVRTLGYGWDEVHDEAESLEHSASDLMIERIDQQLGHPERDPHGDPIPTGDGRIVIPDDAVALAEAGPGAYVITRVSDADPERLVYFADRHLLPGARLTVLRQDQHAGTVTVEPDDGPPTALARTAAGDAIMLVPAQR
jgi:DtxR family Mn-dependent transcriptional regulator